MILSCNVCKELKSEEEFKKDSRRQFAYTRNGRHSMCKKCENFKARTRYEIYPDDSPEMLSLRKCLSCLQEKFLKDFTKSHTAYMGRLKHCKNCSNEKAKERRRKKSPIKLDTSNWTNKDFSRKYRRGLDKESYEELYNNQNGLCAICKKKLELVSKFTCVDHCHITNNIRGILCSKCNFGIGLLNEDINIMENAIQYLIMHGRQSKGTKKE